MQGGIGDTTKIKKKNYTRFISVIILLLYYGKNDVIFSWITARKKSSVNDALVKSPILRYYYTVVHAYNTISYAAQLVFSIIYLLFFFIISFFFATYLV